MCLSVCFPTIGGLGVVEIMEKEQSSVIGKSARGSAKEVPQWIPSLRKEVNSNFVEISNPTIYPHVQTAPVCFVKERMFT